MNNELNNSKWNAEEDYMQTPMSVLKYISDLETAVNELEDKIDYLINLLTGTA